MRVMFAQLTIQRAAARREPLRFGKFLKHFFVGLVLLALGCPCVNELVFVLINHTLLAPLRNDCRRFRRRIKSNKLQPPSPTLSLNSLSLYLQADFHIELFWIILSSYFRCRILSNVKTYFRLYVMRQILSHPTATLVETALLFKKLPYIGISILGILI